MHRPVEEGIPKCKVLDLVSVHTRALHTQASVERFLRSVPPEVTPLKYFPRMTAKERDLMNLLIWLPAMFALGMVTMILCYAFIGACDRI